MKIERNPTASSTVITILAVLFLMFPIAVQAGNLAPSGPPTAGTMHTLDDVYNKTNSTASLPNPEEVTIITKYKDPPGGTIHTVTTGKTFYLMGVSYDPQEYFPLSLSLGEGTKVTKILYLKYNGNYEAKIVSPYPIASFPSGTEVIVNPGYVTIWGYEK